MTTPTSTTTAPSATYPSLRAAWIPLAALCPAFVVEMVDNTLLSIARPTIGRDLGSGTTALQWVTGAYSLTFGGLLLTAGSMADRFGRRRVLLIGLAVFGSLSLCVVAVTSARERRSAAPMLDLGLFTDGTVRGATIAQVGTSIAMASVMFGLILHFQYAYGWSPVGAGLANLPLLVTMIAATPLSEGLAQRCGHRVACLVGAAFLAGSLAGLSWGVEHGYAAIAVCLVLMTIGLRTVMTICAVALVDAMPSNRTSIGAALNDTAQEVGTSVGTTVVGTLIAALVTTRLPAGTWSSDLVASYVHGERITYSLLAVVVGLVAAGGATMLTDSHATEEHP